MTTPARSVLRRFVVPAGRTGRSEHVLLELDLSRGVGEHPPTSPLVALRSLHTPLLRTLVEHLRRAESDRTVVGLVASIADARLTLAQSAELRAAVAGLRRAGKATLAFSPTFGELSPGTTGYHLATAFEEVWLQPSGTVGLVGFTAEAVFLREALDRVGVEPQFGQRHEYKSAADLLVRSGMTEPVREMYQRLVTSATDVVVADVAAARDLPAESVRRALDEAPLDAAAALERGLVDRVGYRDQAYAQIRRRVGTDVRLRYVERHGSSRLGVVLDQVPGTATGRPVVALVHACGPITLSHSGSPAPTGGAAIHADSLGATLRAVGRDETVKAVVLRVDSPGGSYVASDAVRREILALRETGRPVVASMASVAASGGYFIAMPCDRLLASAGTITGSIGVLAGKAVLRDGLARLGIHRESVAGSARATMFSSNRPFDADELAALDAWLDTVYADFTTKAAADRNLDVEQLRAVARGRVWTGADALERGLVDQLGGLAEAIDVACSLAGLSRAKVDVRPRPRRNPFAAVLPAESSEDVRAAGPVEGPPAWSRLAARLAQLTGTPVTGVLTLPPVQLPGLLAPASALW